MNRSKSTKVLTEGVKQEKATTHIVFVDWTKLRMLFEHNMMSVHY
jgi:hypothetical protein